MSGNDKRLSNSAIIGEYLNREKKRKEKAPFMGERMHRYELTRAGKKASIDEYFGTPLEEQEIAKIGPYEDPRTTITFTNAYNYTNVSLSRDIIPEDIRDYYEEVSSSVKKKHR